ncbi:MAG: hypothetical protein NC117_10940 [Pseudoflavonifractor sp.]|nr:hypothetical protein [Pseudoflavonifractor sp.]
MPILKYVSRLLPIATATACMLSIQSCQKGNNVEKMEIRRLDLAVAAYADADSTQRRQIRDSLSDGISALSVIYPDVTDRDRFLDSLSRSSSTRMFMPDVMRRLPSLDSLETVIGGLRERVSKKLPAVRFPDIYSVVSPYNQSVINVDSTMLIALNHYLGADYEGYLYFEPYQRITKTPAHLPYDIAESLIAASYPDKAEDGRESVLGRMLYDGAVINAVMETVPDASLSEALGYSETQLDWARDNEAKAWNQLVTRQLLYSTDPLMVERMVKPSPATTLIHPDSPGRLGRYIGYRIIRSWLDNGSDRSAGQLLTDGIKNPQSILLEAKYSPK